MRILFRPGPVKTMLMMLALLAAFWCAGVTLAQGEADPSAAAPEAESFAKTFFVSRATHADGSVGIDIVGSLLLWTLLILSMVNVGLIGYLAMINQRKSIVPAGVVTEVRKLIAAGDFRRALEITGKDESFFSRVMHAGLTQGSNGLGAVIRAAEQTAEVLVTARMRPIEFLYMLGQVSPMMGLLGTVYGIIFAFRVFVSMGGHASPSLLAGGIGTALVATFWGLVVAIPALAGYALLRSKVDALTLEATVAAEEIFSQFRSKPGAAPTAAKPAILSAVAAAKPAPQPNPNT